MKNVLSKQQVNDIVGAINQLLLDQSSITIDYLQAEQLCDWQRTNEHFIATSLDVMKDYLTKIVELER